MFFFPPNKLIVSKLRYYYLTTVYCLDIWICMMIITFLGTKNFPDLTYILCVFNIFGFYKMQLKTFDRYYSHI